jgi:hypothetical protein
MNLLQYVVFKQYWQATCFVSLAQDTPYPLFCTQLTAYFTFRLIVKPHTSFFPVIITSPSPFLWACFSVYWFYYSKRPLFSFPHVVDNTIFLIFIFFSSKYDSSYSFIWLIWTGWDRMNLMPYWVFFLDFIWMTLPMNL